MATNNCTISFDYSSVMSELNSIKIRLKPALTMVTETMAKKMESWAKDNAPWNDITGNARQTLTGRSYWDSATMVVAELSHGVDYGIWLELAHNREYAILEQALEANKSAIMTAWSRAVGI